MDLTAQFIGRYRKEFDYYEQACRIAAQTLDSKLQSGGIRAIVTWRAKNAARLETKVAQRNRTRNYQSIAAIYDDIVDLAGVRVALYFPAESEEVGRIIRSSFELAEPPKAFPDNSKANYEKRFSGYWATHYRVRLSEGSLPETQKRYVDARIEIQVASVLMHAWSEVEHDLVYKPTQGALSIDEYKILDELNGLVLAGEIALERLQRAAETRASAHGRKYANHYELASSLVEMARDKLEGFDLRDSIVGRVDRLFALLAATQLDTPERVRTYIESLHTDFEKRPLSEQIIDQILDEDLTRYEIFDRVRAAETPLAEDELRPSSETLQYQAVGAFIADWIRLETTVRERTQPPFRHRNILSWISTLSDSGSEDLRDSLDRLRRFRNQLVHGDDIPPPDTIRVYNKDLRKVIKRVKHLLNATAPNPDQSSENVGDSSLS